MQIHYSTGRDHSLEERLGIVGLPYQGSQPHSNMCVRNTALEGYLEVKWVIECAQRAEIGEQRAFFLCLPKGLEGT